MNLEDNDELEFSDAEEFSRDDEAKLLDAEDIFISPQTPNASQNIHAVINFNQSPDSVKHLSTRDQFQKDNIDALKTMYQEYNERYGIQVKIDIESITANFKSIMDPRNRDIFEIYLSEAYGRFRLVFFQKALVAIADLMEQVTNPAKLRDQDTPDEHKYGMMSQLFDLMERADSVYQKLRIDDVEVKLKRAGESVSDNTKAIKDPKMQMAMDAITRMIFKEDDSK